MTPRYSLTIKRSCQREMRSLPADVLRSVHQAIQSNFSTNLAGRIIKVLICG